MRLFGRRSDPLAPYIVLPLNDPRLPEIARRLADFAVLHSGKGHQLKSVRTGKNRQTIVCSCGLPGAEEPRTNARLALMEDEMIDDDGLR